MSKSPRILLAAALALGIVAAGTPAVATPADTEVSASATVGLSAGGARVALDIWDW